MHRPVRCSSHSMTLAEVLVGGARIGSGAQMQERPAGNGNSDHPARPGRAVTARRVAGENRAEAPRLLRPGRSHQQQCVRGDIRSGARGGSGSARSFGAPLIDLCFSGRREPPPIAPSRRRRSRTPGSPWRRSAAGTSCPPLPRSSSPSVVTPQRLLLPADVPADDDDGVVATGRCAAPRWRRPAARFSTGRPGCRSPAPGRPRRSRGAGSR